MTYINLVLYQLVSSAESATSLPHFNQNIQDLRVDIRNNDSAAEGEVTGLC
jgi:hypothetical protein